MNGEQNGLYATTKYHELSTSIGVIHQHAILDTLCTVHFSLIMYDFSQIHSMTKAMLLQISVVFELLFTNGTQKSAHHRMDAFVVLQRYLTAK